MPTRDQKTARALGVFLGFTTAVILAYWVGDHLELRTDWDPPGMSLQANGGRSGSFKWLSDRTDETPCDFSIIVRMKSHSFERVMYTDRYGNYERFENVVWWTSRGLLAVLLALVFRVVQFAVRTFYPVNDLPEDDENLNMQVSGSEYEELPDSFRNIESVVRANVRNAAPSTLA